MKSVLPWSYSSYDAFNTCPKRFYHTKVLKDFVEELGPAVVWGNEVHKALELRVKYGTPMPTNMQQWEPLAAHVASANGTIHCELKLAVNNDLEPCGFFDNGCWSRGVEDVLIVHEDKALSIDWKTGKKKPNSKQLTLSACRVFAKYPEVTTVTTAFAWLQTNEWTRATYTRDELNGMWESFYDGVSAMLWAQQHDAWPAKPSGLCKKYCPVTSCPSNGQYRRK